MYSFMLEKYSILFVSENKNKPKISQKVKIEELQNNLE